MTQDVWYKPVNIGQHYLNFMAEEEISPEETDYYLCDDPENIICKNYYTELEKLMKEWVEDNEELPPDFHNDPYFNLNKERIIDFNIAGFSEEKVNVTFFFNYGTSRWHKYNALLANLMIPRNEKIDSILNMNFYEDLYKNKYKELGHGSSFMEMENILGNHYFEYIGQSLQLQNIYYEEDDVEICIQDGVIKYIKKGRPGWMDSDLVEKK